MKLPERITNLGLIDGIEPALEEPSSELTNWADPMMRPAGTHSIFGGTILLAFFSIIGILLLRLFSQRTEN